MSGAGEAGSIPSGPQVSGVNFTQSLMPFWSFLISFSPVFSRAGSHVVSAALCSTQREFWQLPTSLGGRAHSPGCARRGKLPVHPWVSCSPLPHPNRLLCLLHLPISSRYLLLMLFYISITMLRNTETSLFKLLRWRTIH